MDDKLTISIDYPPHFASRWGRGRPVAQHLERLLLRDEPRQQAFLSLLHRFGADFERIGAQPSNERDPHWDQVWFPPLDGMSLYTLIAQGRPARYVEIGSGNSTKFAHRAVRDHATATRITSIDPAPRAEIDALADAVVRSGLESVDPALFDELAAGDVLLFDGSHRSFMNSDVTVFFIDVLPRLAPGVIVGVHDIFWPDDYPPAWLDRHYNEQYLLGAWLLGAGRRVETLFACHWMGQARAGDVARGLSPALQDTLRAAGKKPSGGCLWFLAPAADTP